MVIDTELAKSIRTRIGVAERHTLGLIDAVLIRRYARAIGDDNPLYNDSAYARSRGFADIVAPPNLIVSVVGWGSGPPTSALRLDGTEAGGHLPGVPEHGIRVMGGGEELVFYRPVVAGATVVVAEQLQSVDEKATRQGTMLVLRYDNEYTDDGGLALVRARRTMLLR